MHATSRSNERALAGAGASPSTLRRVLVISHVGDSKYKNGGTVYTRSLLELIATGHPGVEVDLVFFARQSSVLAKRIRQAQSLLQSVFSPLPSKALYFRSRAFAEKLVTQVGSADYDLVMLDHAEMLWCLDVVPPSIPIVAVAHNIEGRLYEQFIRHRPISRRLLAADLRKYQRFETERLRRVRNVIFISAEDATELQRAIPELNVLVVPPTFAYSPGARSGSVSNPLRVGMLGNFGWWPNREAYEWFVEHVWRQLGTGRELHVFGAESESLSPAPRTILHGYVQDLAEVWSGVDLMVNPIVSGSGINVKVAEAIYNGMPMLCTSMAVAGLLTEPDPAIAVLDRPMDWVHLLRGEEAVVLAQRSPRSATRGHVAASTHVERMAEYLGELRESARDAACHDCAAVR